MQVCSSEVKIKKLSFSKPIYVERKSETQVYGIIIRAVAMGGRGDVGTRTVNSAEPSKRMALARDRTRLALSFPSVARKGVTCSTSSATSSVVVGSSSAMLKCEKKEKKKSDPQSKRFNLSE